MQSMFIQSATNTTLTYTTPSLSARTSSRESLPDDQVNLRPQSQAFAGMDPEQNTWDVSSMDSSLTMIRAGQGIGVHGNLDSGRVAGLLSDVGLGSA